MLYKADFPPLYWASILVSLREGIAGRWEANQQAAARAIHPVGHDYWDWPSGGLEGQAIFVHDASINGVPRSHALEGYFQLLVDRFAERGIPVLIAAMPINEPTSQAITQRAKDEYSAFLHSLSGGHGNVTVLEPIWTVLPSTSFADDSGHVNRAGQAELTRLIDRCIVALLHPAESHGAADCTMDHHAL